MSEYRQPTDWEQRVFRRLLQVSFPGRDEVEAQVRGALVKTIYEDGSLTICTQTAQQAPVVQRIPVQAECKDTDGMMIRVLLHVVRGVVDELEIYKVDGSPIRKMPDLEEWDVFVLPPPPITRKG